MSASERDAVRAALLRFTAAAAREARLIREREEPDLEFLREHLRSYILAKYMLPPEEAEGDGIRDLTEQSLARMMRVTPELAQVLDTARSCAGATSLTVKRALLFQAMERDLRIVLPADKTVQAKDVAELARLVQTCKKAPDPQS